MISNKRFKLLLSVLFPLLIFLIAGFICFKNYTPNTYLIGWDSLHPEFNFPEAFRRVWEGVWRAEQGLGVVAAHSHMADLPRLVFLWLESFILPASLLRYSYVFLCLILGPLGVYFFLKYVFQKEKESLWVYPSAFLGGLFYLLNLGTLQNFYVPFEMFPAAFAFIPWIAFAGLKYLREGGKLNLIFWTVIVIVSSPMAYAATLWYASFAGLFIFFGVYSLIASPRGTKFKRFLILAITALFLNLYWILPNIYSIVNQSGVISNSNINRLFSQEAFLRNRDYGNFADILIQKNFLFGWRSFDSTANQFTDLLGVWTKYLSIPAVLATGYILAGISILGLLLGIFKRDKIIIATIPASLLVLFFLININPPTGGLYAYLYNNFGVFAEGFRMPFTKFSILYEFIASFYFGYFVFALLTLKTRSLKVIITAFKKTPVSTGDELNADMSSSFGGIPRRNGGEDVIVFIKGLIFVAITAGLIYFTLPAFNGWLIGPNVRKSLPGEYQQIFNWFNSNSSGRVALFPINSKYGWEYRSWGYEGSGFLTYGITNPILYRDFDRWSIGNEDFYAQSAFALYANDTQSFVNTLKKYQVKYLLLDESIINPGGTADILKIPELKKIFLENGFREAAKFGFLTIYETGYEAAEVSAPSKYTQITSDLSYSPIDEQYASSGAYINTGNLFPIRNSPDLPSGSPAVSENFSINRGFADAYNCDLKKIGSVFKENSSQGILLRAEGGGAACDYLPYPDLKYNQAYVLRIAGENRQGRSLKIYLFNEGSQVPEIEEILPSGGFDQTYFVYPKNATGSGYILNLETRSFGRISSENLLTKVEFYPLDYSYVQGDNLYVVYSIQNDLKVSNVKKYGTWAYKIETSGEGLLELGQGYEPGWIGIAISRQPLAIRVLSHIKINSWANGWVVDPGSCSQLKIINCKLLIVYWSQLLEWGGGILGLAALIVLVLRRKNRQVLTRTDI